MADPASRSEELVAVLHRGGRIEPKLLVQADLRGADLSGMRFEQMDLSGARLNDAKLAGRSWTGCRLDNACLDGDVLSNAYFSECTARRPSLRGTLLSQPWLQKSAWQECD